MKKKRACLLLLLAFAADVWLVPLLEQKRKNTPGTKQQNKARI